MDKEELRKHRTWAANGAYATAAHSVEAIIRSHRITLAGQPRQPTVQQALEQVEVAIVKHLKELGDVLPGVHAIEQTLKEDPSV